ncbi:dTDP-4-dehydrorhamnose reductase [Paenibacillus taichungensis]|uniref:dTDP-4-dehydrorhamnose reductase n=1 Tax=Paenibacillus taichungensis TaxID=484184 RepID=UPI003D9A6D5B
MLILGGFGLLGQEVYRQFKEDGHQVVRTSRHECDINNLSSLKLAIEKHRPEVIIHSAGITNVDKVEDDPLEAYTVNSLSMYNLLESVAESKPIIIFISTDYVFDGYGNTPYKEADDRKPINVYGKSKMLAEDILKSNYEKYYIVRTSWLFGKGGKCFPDTIVRVLFDDARVLNVVNDQWGTPTYTVDLSESLLELIGCPFGTYHITNTGITSWYEFAKLIAEVKQNGHRRICSVSSGEYPTRARRPRYSVLDNSNWLLNKRPLRHYSEALHSFFIT